MVGIKWISYIVVIKSNAMPKPRPSIIYINPMRGTNADTMKTAIPAQCIFIGIGFASVPLSQYSTTLVTLSNPKSTSQNMSRR